MRVLIACEYSGVVRDAFIALGHDAISCDLLETESPGPHFCGDVAQIIDSGFDLMIAHPPCTYLSNSGARWLYTQEGRFDRMRDAAAFFRMLYDAPIKYKAIENPIMHGHAKAAIGGLQQSQVIQPWMFGHLETKATCLWLQNLPCLTETNNVRNEMMKLPYAERSKIHFMPPGPDRQKERSRTFKGIADAMASQWSAYIMAKESK